MAPPIHSVTGGMMMEKGRHHGFNQD